METRRPLSRGIPPLLAAGVDRLADLLRRDPLPARPLVVVAAAVVTGAAAVRWLPLVGPHSVALPCWLAAAAAVAAWWRSARGGRDRAAATALLLAVALAAAAWSAARFDLFPRDDLAWELSTSPVPVAVRARVEAAPRPLVPSAADRRQAAAIGPSSECVVAVEAVRDGARWRPATGRATMIVLGEPSELLAGSRLRIFGRGLRPAPALNPGEFDAAVRSRAERCLSILRVDSWDCVEVITRPGRWSPAAVLDRVRVRAAAVLAAGIAPDRAPLAAALLLGSRQSLPAAGTDDFVVTGTIHVLAISGLHVGLLAGGLFAVLRGFLVPRGWATLAVAAVTGLYAVLVGAEAPVVRATLQVWAACLAAAAGRRPATLTALAGAAIPLVAWRPAEVMAPGAQLSFLSTAILVGVAVAVSRPREADPIERLIERSRPPWERRIRRAAARTTAAAVTGLAVWLATAPLVAARFHVVTPVAVLANLLIAPLVPVAMACGFVCLLVAPLSPPLAVVAAAGCDAALAATGLVVGLAAEVPAGHAWVAGPAAWWVAGWYALLAGALTWLRRDLLPRPATWALLASGWAAVGVGAAAVAGHPSPGLRVVMAAVGHGCGVVVRAPTGRCLLYDAGRLGGPAAARRSVAAVLWSEGVVRLDAIVVSHADADHFNAVPEILARFPTDELVVPAELLASAAPGVADLLRAAGAAGVPVRTARAGDSFPLGPLCRVRVLHPARAAQGPDIRRDGRAADNASSLVLSVEAAGRRLLLTGDLEGESLAAFNAAGPGPCDVLVAPHHGSRSSLPADIARATVPGLVLVSGREGRSWPEVHRAYAAAAALPLDAVLQTGTEGALAVTLTAGGLTAERFFAGGWRPLPVTVQVAAARDGLVNSQPPARSRSWLATYAPRSTSTPLVNP